MLGQHLIFSRKFCPVRRNPLVFLLVGWVFLVCLFLFKWKYEQIFNHKNCFHNRTSADVYSCGANLDVYHTGVDSP